MTSAARILSLGSINADFQVRLGRPLEDGLTLFASEFTRLSGGKAANVAALARRLGVSATLYGRVGDDDLAEQALAPLRAAGVDLVHVSRAHGRSTAVSMITVPPSGKKTIVLAPNANDDGDGGPAREVCTSIEAAPEGSVLVVDFEVPATVVRTAVAAAQRRDFKIVADPSPADRAEREVLQRVTLLVPNAKEAGELSRIEVVDAESGRTAAVKLLELGPKAVCVKLPEGGCVLARDGQGGLVIGPVDVPVVDTTGAGDAFAGALAVGLLEGRSLDDAAISAVAASHLAIMNWGSQPAYPTREELDAFRSRISARSWDSGSSDERT